MSTSTAFAAVKAGEQRYTISVARDENTIREAQKLRYRVFNEELGSPYHAEQGREVDGYDRYCDHLIARRTDTGEIVGTYRLLSPEGAARAGGLSSEALFDLSPHRALRPSLVELTRACVHPDHRTGPVISMLWAGTIRYMAHGRHAWLSGRMTFPLFDGGALAAACRDQVVAGGHIAPDRYHVRPHTLWEPPANDRPDLPMPPKLRGFLLAGTWVCSEFAYDPPHDEVSLYLLLSLENTDPHRRKFLLSLGERLTS
ncbi:GNAT family N-acyltransferase [Streptomyces sp. NPDC046876]|uniref:GNAT family N-acetyltransferase n=1 Tax=Streptomyces sp. NPDC046876 TaxID=3155616 RepID=UPI0033E5287E